MTDEHHGPELVRDDDLTRELAALYAPPADLAYWTALEDRIFARLDVFDGEWWSVPDRWLRVGLVAAAIALLVAGSVLLRQATHSTAAARMAAYESAVDSAASDAFEIARRGRLTEEQATLRLLIGRD
ncbi:MAG TPA: hypothetical protein VJL28_09415 [Gemmatimonadaceae bacterium]|nr:hypothetical protein [Gemmatimonadaceae bacterium]